GDGAGLAGDRVHGGNGAIVPVGCVQHVGGGREEQRVGRTGERELVFDFPGVGGDGGDGAVAGVGDEEPTAGFVNGESARMIEIADLGDEAAAGGIEDVDRAGAGVGDDHASAGQGDGVEARAAGEVEDRNLAQL